MTTDTINYKGKNMDIQKNISNIINNFSPHIKRKLIPIRFNVGDYIIREGDLAEYGFFFVSGRYDVIKTDILGNNFIIAKDQIATFCSLMDIFSDNEIQCSSVRVSKEAKGFKLYKKYCKELIKENLEFSSFLIKIWATIFYDSNINPNNSPLYPYKYKLLQFLIQQKVSDSTDIIFNIDRQTLSEVIGCSKRTIFRQLKTLEQEELIQIKNSAIIIKKEKIDQIETILDSWE